MKARPDSSRRLRLEALETRTLLAADLSDPFGLVADFNLAMQAVAGTGFHVSFDTRFGNQRLLVAGTGTGSLAIDLDHLPSFVTDLEIDSVASVTFTGTDHLENLILSGIGSVTAEGLKVDQQLVAKDVGSISVASVGEFVVLSGSKTALSIHSMGELGGIYFNLDQLTLTTDAPGLEFYPIKTETTIVASDLTSAKAIHLHGDDPTLVHVVLPAVDNGHSTPDTPPSSGDGGDVTQPPPSSGAGDGSNDPAESGQSGSSPGSKPDPFVIVTLPLDEQTRALLEQLRRLLDSSQPDAEERIVDLLSHGNLDLPQVSPAAAFASARIDFETKFGAARPLIGDDAGLVLSHASPFSKFGSESLNPAIWSLNDKILVRSSDAASAPLPDSLRPSQSIDVDLSWPVLLPTREATDRAASRQEQNDGIGDFAATGTVQALGTYIIERVIAEFSPGQQSLVLLVDPQPTRVPGSNKKSATETPFALGGLPVALSEV